MRFGPVVGTGGASLRLAAARSGHSTRGRGGPKAMREPGGRVEWLRHACSEAYGRASEDKVRIQERDAESLGLQDMREVGASEHERLSAPGQPQGVALHPRR